MVDGTVLDVENVKSSRKKYSSSTSEAQTDRYVQGKDFPC